jgi:hypothetical protein
MAMDTPRTVLFVCQHGAAKSVLAAAYFQRMADGRGLPVRASFAGTEPDPEIAPRVVKELLADGIDLRARRPRQVTRDDVARAWRVVSFNCDLSGLAGPGREMERWDDVPPVSDDFIRARAAIVARLARLLEECAKTE